MPGETNGKQVIRRLTEAFDGCDEQVIRESFTDDFIAHGMPPGFAGNADGMVQLATHLKAGFPDGKTVIDDIVAEDDKVVARLTSRGTQKGEVMGVPASDRTVTVTGIEIYRLSNGKIAEYWGEYNMFDLFGPPPGQSG